MRKKSVKEKVIKLMLGFFTEFLQLPNQKTVTIFEDGIFEEKKEF